MHAGHTFNAGELVKQQGLVVLHVAHRHFELVVGIVTGNQQANASNRSSPNVAQAGLTRAGHTKPEPLAKPAPGVKPYGDDLPQTK